MPSARTPSARQQLTAPIFAPPEPRTWQTLLARASKWEQAGEDHAALRTAGEAADLATQVGDSGGQTQCSARVAGLLARLDKARAAKERGNVAFKARRFDEAERCYEEALRHFAREFDALSNRCNCLLKRGEYDAALTDARTVLRTEPGRIKVAWRGAQALVALDQPTGAIAMLDAFAAETAKGKAAQPSASEAKALKAVREEARAKLASGQALAVHAARVRTQTVDESTDASTALRGVQGRLMHPLEVAHGADVAVATAAAAALSDSQLSQLLHAGHVQLTLPIDAAQRRELCYQAKQLREAGYLTAGGQTETRVRDDRVCWLSRPAAGEMLPALANAVALLARLVDEINRRAPALQRSTSAVTPSARDAADDEDGEPCLEVNGEMGEAEGSDEDELALEDNVSGSEEEQITLEENDEAALVALEAKRGEGEGGPSLEDNGMVGSGQAAAGGAEAATAMAVAPHTSTLPELMAPECAMVAAYEIDGRARYTPHVRTGPFTHQYLCTCAHASTNAVRIVRTRVLSLSRQRDNVHRPGGWLNDRVLTLICYVNEGWREGEGGGSLRIHPHAPADAVTTPAAPPVDYPPIAGKVAIFRSDLLHEVLPSVPYAGGASHRMALTMWACARRP